jgi:hypothetical protein
MHPGAQIHWRLVLRPGRDRLRRRRDGAVGQHAEHRADFHLGTLRDADFAQRASGRRVHLHGNLVGLKFHQRLVGRHRIACLLQPARDGRGGDALAQRGHLDFGRHGETVQSL